MRRADSRRGSFTFDPPRLTTAERDAIAAADLQQGSLIYNTTVGKLQVYIGVAWQTITSA